MRARNIKPDFFRDAELAEVSLESRYLFIGLWCLADKEGKLKDNIKQIRFEIFPETKTREPIDALLMQLHDHNLIIRYIVDEIKYIKVRNFLKHQNPHSTEKSSIYPDPPTDNVNSRELTLDNVEIPLIPDSLIPDSLIHIKNTSSSGDDGFTLFWKTYPKKIGKGDALKKWAALRKSKSLPSIEIIITAIENQKTWEQWQSDGGKYIPHPATWLSQGRWDDEQPQGGQPQWIKELSKNRR